MCLLFSSAAENTCSNSLTGTLLIINTFEQILSAECFAVKTVEHLMLICHRADNSNDVGSTSTPATNIAERLYGVSTGLTYRSTPLTGDSQEFK